MSVTHGLAGTYRSQVYRCRCEQCRAANTERTKWERQRRAERLVADPSLAPHGSEHTYKNWGCRCVPCSDANAEMCRQWKARQRGRTS